jgi:hypothetical protein
MDAFGMTPLSLFDLFIRPGRFFARGRALPARAGLVAALLLYGLGAGIARLEHQAAVRLVLKARGITPRRQAPFLASISADWMTFWGHAALSAILAAALLWTLGAWWFRLRARWSGAPDAEMGTSREIYVWSGLVLAVPVFVLALVQTALFPSFRMAWAQASLWTLVLIVFPFWSAFTSYAGVRALFPVKRGRAILWFLVLPWLLYALAFAGLGASILHMELKSGPAKIIRTPATAT